MLNVVLSSEAIPTVHEAFAATVVKRQNTPRIANSSASSQPATFKLL